MSEGFRCDGCDEFYGGTPTEIDITNEYGTIGDKITVGHSAGYDDAFPSDDEPMREVLWPFHSTNIDLCADCTADKIVPAIQELAKEKSRYG